MCAFWRLHRSPQERSTPALTAMASTRAPTPARRGARRVPGGLAKSVRALAVAPSSPLTLYVGTETSGVYRSRDGAQNWQAVNTGLEDLAVRAIAIDPTNAAVVYAGTNRAVFKTTDAGAQWVPAVNGLPEVAVNALAVDPEDPGHGVRRHRGRRGVPQPRRRGDVVRCERRTQRPYGAGARSRHGSAENAVRGHERDAVRDDGCRRAVADDRRRRRHRYDGNRRRADQSRNALRGGRLEDGWGGVQEAPTAARRGRSRTTDCETCLYRRW